MPSFLRAAVIAVVIPFAPAAALAQETVEAEVEAEGSHETAHGHHDPSKHYNWFDLGYKKKDSSGGKLGDKEQEGMPPGEEEPMSAPFALMVLNFGLLLVLLAKFGGPAARKMAENRSDQIKGALDEAAKLRQAAADKLEEYNAKLSAAESEMKAMLDGMRADAEAERARIVAAAEAQAATIKRDAEMRIAAEIQLARVELTREVALAATVAAEQLLREKATAADQTKLIETFVKDVEQAAAGQGAV
jgi:F-type H+-transporting ATPase subunit b